MTEIERLSLRVVDMGIKDIKPFIDLDNPPLPEDLAREINRALDQLESGDYTLSTFDDKYLVEIHEEN